MIKFSNLHESDGLRGKGLRNLKGVAEGGVAAAAPSYFEGSDDDSEEYRIDLRVHDYV